MAAKKYRKKKKRLLKLKPPTTEEWLEAYILKQVEGEEYIDNLRWAALGDVEQMRKYNDAKDDGCCGFFDGEVTAPDGFTYAVGCNFGH